MNHSVDVNEMMSQNYFDRIPDDVVRLILDRVLDAKSLCACLAVSTRFNSIALHSTNLSLSVDRIHFNDDSDDEDTKHNLLRSLFKLFICTPLRFLTRLASSQTEDGVVHSSSAAVYYSPTQALKSFSNIEILKINLPSHGELQLDKASNPLLKWKATFGSELKTCVIVAANSVDQISMNPNSDEEEERRGSEFEAETNGKNKEERHRAGGLESVEAEAPPPPFAISNEDLKMRVVWTISCLIAASWRHHLLKRIVSEHPMLKSIEMVDEHQQGTLTMDESDIYEMRTTISTSNADSSSSGDDETERSRIPALKMKMWHAAELELPGCKRVMKGATLVVIRVADAAEAAGDGMEEVFDETMYGEAAREITRKMKRSYSLEMESF